MKLLLDEMYSVVVAEQLRSRGHDVVSVNEPSYRWLAGRTDVEIYTAAVAEDRVIVTEDVKDFMPLEAAGVVAGKPRPGIIFTTNRRFPRHTGAGIAGLVIALDALMSEPSPAAITTLFLKPPA